MIAAAICCAALVMGAFAGTADAFIVPSTGSFGTMSFSTSSGTVSCEWSTISSNGVGPNYTSGPNSGAGGAYDVSASAQPCKRNGVSVQGTGAGQYYAIFAYQLLGNTSICGNPLTFTSYPAYVNPSTGYAWQTYTSPTCFGTAQVRTLVAVCAGGGGSCSFPVIGHTVSYSGWSNPA